VAAKQGPNALFCHCQIGANVTLCTPNRDQMSYSACAPGGARPRKRRPKPSSATQELDCAFGSANSNTPVPLLENVSRGEARRSRACRRAEPLAGGQTDRQTDAQHAGLVLALRSPRPQPQKMPALQTLQTKGPGVSKGPGQRERYATLRGQERNGTRHGAPDTQRGRPGAHRRRRRQTSGRCRRRRRLGRPSHPAPPPSRCLAGSLPRHTAGGAHLDRRTDRCRAAGLTTDRNDAAELETDTRRGARSATQTRSWVS
jgi:hypothetical protein